METKRLGFISLQKKKKKKHLADNNYMLELFKKITSHVLDLNLGNIIFSLYWWENWGFKKLLHHLNLAEN